jgi:phage RecT family recombinase
MSNAALKAVTQREAAPRPKTIFDYLEDKRVRDGIAAVAGRYLSADRMLRLCVNAVKKTPLLTRCDPQTVLGAMMTSSALGLEPNTIQQQAFLIPYKKRVKIGDEWVDTYECQFQVGARGFITLAYRSPHIKSIVAEAIHDGDLFEHMEGSDAFLRYSKTLRDRGPLIGAFSYARLADGGETACVLPLSEIEKIRSRSETFRALVRNVEEAKSDRDRSKAEQKLAETPWVMWEDDMASKSVIKKHAKQLPIASGDALLAAAELDSRADSRGVDMRAMADPDLVRTVVGDGVEPPAIEHNPSGTLEDLVGAQTIHVDERGEPEPAATSKAPARAAKAADVPAHKSYAEVREALERAPTVDALDEAATGIELVAALDQAKELSVLYRELRTKLEG